jgi:formamidopyrimidine-DNA glycosylase
MPELPEVCHIVDQLYDFMKKHNNPKLIRTEFTSGRYIRHGLPDDWELLKDNLPLVWNNVNCKGKMIYFKFKNKYNDTFYIKNTLAMTGSWSLKKSKHTHLIMTFQYDNNTPISLYFSDPRNFGTLSIFFDEVKFIEKLNSIGQSWLSDYYPNNVMIGKRIIQIKLNDFIEVVNKKTNFNNNIVKFLMDQSKFSGIGNYLLSEVLYDSKINPFLNICDIPKDKMIDLYNSISKIIKASYDLDGVSLKDYHGLDNQVGEYQHNLAIYNRKQTDKGEDIIKIIGPHKRSVYHTLYE